MLLPMTSLPPKPQKPEEGRGSKAQVGWQACSQEAKAAHPPAVPLTSRLQNRVGLSSRALLQTTKPHGDGLMFAAPVSRGSQ